LKRLDLRGKKLFVKKTRKPHAGFTLIELVVAMAISAILLGSLASVFILTYKSYDANTSQAQAQNLALLTVQKIQSEVRTCSCTTICKTETDISAVPTNDNFTYTPIYYDSQNHGIDIGGNTYLAGTFKNYGCILNFSCTAPTANLLNLTVNITDSSGNTLYSTSTSIYTQYGSISTAVQRGIAIVCSFPNTKQ